MQEILKQIVNKNHKERNGKIFISTLLFRFLTDDIPIDDSYIKIKINEIEFIEIETIPKDLRNELGLFRTKGMQNDENNEKFDYPQKKDVSTVLAEVDLTNAIHDTRKHKHEFIDYFVEPTIIETKARTLSIILRIRNGGMNNVQYLKAVHKTLISENIQCELPTESFKQFHNKLKWFQRIGFVNGLIRNDYDPNI